ncbi:hypothetical protein HDU91_003328, partial [Kappamyces sp. JEL0680]
LGSLGKIGDVIDCAQTSLKHLAWISPHVVLPEILPKLYPSLETLMESHRTLSAMTLLTLVMPPLDAEQVVPFLNLVLNGIDVNDVQKTNFACLFFCHTFCYIPIVDASRSVADSPIHMDAVRASTAGFGSFLERYFDAIFLVFRNLPENYAVSDQLDNDDSMIRAIVVTSEVLLAQLSDTLESLVIGLLQSRIHDVYPSAIEGVGYVFGSVASRHPIRRLDAFFDVCCHALKAELQNGAGSVASSSSFSTPFGMTTLSDAALHWYQEILLRILSNAGPAILAYRDKIENFIDICIKHCASKSGYTRAFHTLRAVVESLLFVYPLNISSHSTKQWESGLDCSSWGETHSIADTEIEWHYPSPGEVEFGLYLLEKYFALSTKKLSCV